MSRMQNGCRRLPGWATRRVRRWLRVLRLKRVHPAHFRNSVIMAMRGTSDLGGVGASVRSGNFAEGSETDTRGLDVAVRRHADGN